MNAVIESGPLEALAVNYLRYGFLTAVNSVWAWAAAVTAAVSFWMIKPLSEISVPVVHPEINEMRPVAVSTTLDDETKNMPSVSKTTSCGVLERVKFTMYYGCEDEHVTEGVDGDGDGGVEAIDEELEWVCDDWERLMAVRKGDMGWYRCQDLAAFDGSVVRLWGGRRRRRAAAELLVNGGSTW